MSDYSDALEQMVEMAVEGMSSYDMRRVIEDLPDNQEDCAEAFCKRFSMGYWFMESLSENDIDIVNVLNRFADILAEEETEQEIEERFTDYSMKRSQGWVH